MNVILLPGNNRRGRQWLQQVDASLAPQFDRTYRHDYAHWETDESEINLDHEAKRLAEMAQSLSPYAVFAKSAGTMLTAMAAAQGKLQPQWAIFAGLPLVMIKGHNLPAREWLKSTTFPITIIQNSRDPYGSYDDVSAFTEQLSHPNLEVIETPGDTHDYTDFELIKNVAGQLLSS